MIRLLVEDIKRALNNGCPFSALSLALTLPDVCGKALYPDEKSSKKRYVDWYDEYIGTYEDSLDKTLPYLSGEVIYSLRCSYLHQNNPNVDSNRIRDERCIINNFTILVEKDDITYSLSDSSSVYTHTIDGDGMGTLRRCYKVSLRRLCLILCSCAEVFYCNHRDRFDFFDYNVIVM